jgi:hypothetical protein
MFFEHRVLVINVLLPNIRRLPLADEDETVHRELYHLVGVYQVSLLLLLGEAFIGKSDVPATAGITHIRPRYAFLPANLRYYFGAPELPGAGSVKKRVPAVGEEGMILAVDAVELVYRLEYEKIMDGREHRAALTRVIDSTGMMLKYLIANC